MSWISWWKSKWPFTAVAAARWPKRKIHRCRQSPHPGHGAAGRQELSSGQLYERLNRRYTQQTSAAVVAEMVQREYINDARYAETRAHALLAAKKSRRAAAQNLRQKGLAAGEIQQALDAVYTPDVSGEDPELEAAAALVEGHYRKKLEAGRRDLVIAALQRRGFSYSVIKEAIRRVEEGE